MASLLERAASTPEAPPAEPPPRRPRWYRRVPVAMWVCMAVAVVNGVVWALITPSFQTPDEPVQAGYVQYLAETGKLPTPKTIYFNGSPEENVAVGGVPFSLTGHPSWSVAHNTELERRLSSGLPRVSDVEAAYVASAPPLYFALETVPYELASSGNFLDRLYAMRFLSALLAGLTVGFVFLFLRELLPRTPLAWTAGALVVAFQPVFGFISGGVNYDNLLWTASAATMWLVARGFRRGLTPRLGVAIGAAVAVGALTKGSIFGLVPGVAVAIVAMVLRSPERRRALLGAATAAAAAAIPFGAWLAASQALFGRTAKTATGTGLIGVHTTFGGQLDYIWQFFLPRLPFMQHQWFWSTRYPHYPLWETYFKGFVGRFGWFAFGFPDAVNWVALAIFVAILALAVTALVRGRGAVMRRKAELVSYVLMAVGLTLLVAAAGYRYRIQTDLNFEQTRYLFPLLPLYAAVVVLAARGAGRRGAPALAVALVVLAFAHDVFSQLLAIGHYYA